MADLTDPDSRQTGVFDTLRELRFSAYVGSSMLFQIGIWMQRVAVGWLVWEMTGSEAWLGMIAACEFVPAIVLGPFAGILADRARPVVVIGVGNAARLVQAALLAAGAVTGIAGPVTLLALMLAGGLATAAVHPSRMSFVSLLVPAAKLPTAIPLDGLSYNIARFSGPTIGGLILIRTDVSALLIVTLFWLLPSVMVLSWMLYRAPAEARASRRLGTGQKSMWADLSEGIGYAIKKPRLLPVIVLIASSSLLIRPLVEILPAFVGTVLKAGPAELASLMSAYGIGAMIGGICLTFRRGFGTMETWHLAGAFVAIVGTAAFLQTKSMPFSVATAALCGGGLTIMGVGAQTILQMTAPPEFRGRVLSLYTMLSLGGTAIGAPIVGFLAEWLGLAHAFDVGIVVTAMIWIVIVHRARRRNDR